MRHPRLLLLLVAGLLALAGCATPTGPGRPAEPATTAPRSPEAPAGQRWVSFGDVIVAVPEAWGHAESPGPAWCAGDPEQFPTEPYVALPQLYRAIPMIACPTLLPPEQHRASSVELGPAAPRGVKPAPFQQPDGDWLILRRAVGVTVITVTVPTADRPLGEEILASARQVEVDHLGCPVTSPVQQGPAARPEPVDLTAQRDAGAVVVCQYATGAAADQFGAPGTPGLIASAELSDTDPAGLLDALADAPAAPEPELADCGPVTGSALTVRLGDAEVYGFPFSCGSTGWLDTGERRVALTRENCAPLFVAPVGFNAADASVYERCRP